MGHFFGVLSSRNIIQKRLKKKFFGNMDRFFMSYFKKMLAISRPMCYKGDSLKQGDYA